MADTNSQFLETNILLESLERVLEDRQFPKSVCLETNVLLKTLKRVTEDREMQTICPWR